MTAFVGEAHEGLAGTEDPQAFPGASGQPEPRGPVAPSDDLDLVEARSLAQQRLGRALGREARRQATLGVALRVSVGVLFGGEYRGRRARAQPGHLVDLHEGKRAGDDTVLSGAKLDQVTASVARTSVSNEASILVMDLRFATVPALASLPGLVHGFEQRPVFGPSESREATRARTEEALEGAGELFLMRQIHGVEVRQPPWARPPEGDAAVAVEPGQLLGIETADCLPVLLVDPRQRAVAAAHAGWRGTVGGVAAAAVRALVARGSRAADLLAATGPSIGPCCYEVGEELREAFGTSGAAFFRPGPRGRPHLDVRAANVRQLQQAGVSPDRIVHVDDCTACHPDRYYSYRRDGAGTGRMISFVGYRTG